MNKIELTQDELLQIMLHFASYTPTVAIGHTRDRLLEVAKDMTPNNELYVIGQKAITEAAMAKREVATAGIVIQELRNAVATALKYIEEIQLGHANDELREKVEAIRKGAKNFAVVR